MYSGETWKKVKLSKAQNLGDGHAQGWVSVCMSVCVCVICMSCGVCICVCAVCLCLCVNLCLLTGRAGVESSRALSSVPCMILYTQ